jgi:hypothetical protein
MDRGGIRLGTPHSRRRISQSEIRLEKSADLAERDPLGEIGDFSGDRTLAVTAGPGEGTKAAAISL